MRRMKLKFAPKVAVPKAKATNAATVSEAECATGTQEAITDGSSSTRHQTSIESQDSLSLPPVKTSNTSSDNISTSSNVLSMGNTAAEASTSDDVPQHSFCNPIEPPVIENPSSEATLSSSSVSCAENVLSHSTNSVTSISSKTNSEGDILPCTDASQDSVGSSHNNVDILTTGRKISIESMTSTSMDSSVSPLKEANVSDKNSISTSVGLDKEGALFYSSLPLAVKLSSSKDSNAVSCDVDLVDSSIKKEPEKSKSKSGTSWSSKKIKPNLHLKRHNAKINASKNASQNSSSTAKETLAIEEDACINNLVEAVPDDLSSRISNIPSKEASLKEKTGVPFTETNTRSIATLSAENIASLNKANKENFNVTRRSRDSDATSQSSVDTSEENRIFLERKQKFRNKLNEGALESQMTMFDLIYFNPANSPMPGRETTSSSKRRKNQDCNTGKAEQHAEEESVDDVTPIEQTTDDLEDKRRLLSVDSVDSGTSASKASEGAASGDDASSVQEDQVQDENSGDCDFLAPRLKVGPDGELIIDQESILIKTTIDKERLDALSSEVIQESEETRKCFTKKRKRTSDWTASEIAYFYKALSTVGTDFSLMQEVFFKKWRTREELKMKFKREERVNKALIDSAVSDSLQYDLSVFESEPEFDADAERAKAKAAERSAVLQRKKMLQLQVQRAKMIERDHKKKQKLEDRVRKKVLRKVEKQTNSVKKPRGRPKKCTNPATEIDVGASPGSGGSQNTCQQKSSNLPSVNNQCVDFFKVEASSDLHDEMLDNSGSSAYNETNSTLDEKHVKVSRTFGNHSSSKKGAKSKKPRQNKKAKLAENNTIEGKDQIASSPCDDTIAPVRRSGRVRTQRKVDYTAQDELDLPSDIEISDEDGDEDYVTGTPCSSILPLKRKRGGKNIKNLFLQAQSEGGTKNDDGAKAQRIENGKEIPLLCDEPEASATQKDGIQRSSSEIETRHVHWKENAESSKLAEENGDSGDAFDVSMIEDDHTDNPDIDDTGPCDTSGAMRANDVSQILLDPAACLSKIDLLDVSLDDAADSTSSKSCNVESVSSVAPAAFDDLDNSVTESLLQSKPKAKSCDVNSRKNTEKKSNRSPKKSPLSKTNATRTKKSSHRRRRTKVVLASSSEDENEFEEDSVLKDTDRLKVMEDSGSTIKLQLQGIRLDELTSPHPVKLGPIANTSLRASQSHTSPCRNPSNECLEERGEPSHSSNTRSMSPRSETSSQESKTLDDGSTFDGEEFVHSSVKASDPSTVSDDPESSSVLGCNDDGGVIDCHSSVKANHTSQNETPGTEPTSHLSDRGIENSTSTYENEFRAASKVKFSSSGIGAPENKLPATLLPSPNSSQMIDKIDVCSLTVSDSCDTEKITNGSDAGGIFLPTEKIRSCDLDDNLTKISNSPSNSIVSMGEKGLSSRTNEESSFKSGAVLAPTSNNYGACPSESPVASTKDGTITAQGEVTTASATRFEATETLLPVGSSFQEPVPETKRTVPNLAHSVSVNIKDVVAPPSQATTSDLLPSSVAALESAAAASVNENIMQLTSTLITSGSSVDSSYVPPSCSPSTNSSCKFSDDPPVVAKRTVTTALPRRAKIKIAPKLKSSTCQIRLKAARGAPASNASNIIPSTTASAVPSDQGVNEKSATSVGNTGRKFDASKFEQECSASRNDEKSATSTIDATDEFGGASNSTEKGLERCGETDDRSVLQNSSLVSLEGIPNLTVSVLPKSKIGSNNNSLHAVEEQSYYLDNTSGINVSNEKERESSVCDPEKEILNSCESKKITRTLENKLVGKISSELIPDAQSGCPETMNDRPSEKHPTASNLKDLPVDKEEQPVLPHVLKGSTAGILHDQEKDRVETREADNMEADLEENRDSQEKSESMLDIEAVNEESTSNSIPKESVRKYSEKSSVHESVANFPRDELRQCISTATTSQLFPSEAEVEVAGRFIEKMEVIQASEHLNAQKINSNSENVTNTVIKSKDVNNTLKSPETKMPMNLNSMTTRERVFVGHNVVQDCRKMTSGCPAEFQCSKQSSSPSAVEIGATNVNNSSPSPNSTSSEFKDADVCCLAKNYSDAVPGTLLTNSSLHSSMSGRPSVTIQNVVPGVHTTNIHSQGAQHAELAASASKNSLLENSDPSMSSSNSSLNCSVISSGPHIIREPGTIMSVISHKSQRPGSEIAPILQDVRQVSSVISTLAPGVQLPGSAISSFSKDIHKSASVISSLPHGVQTDSVVCNEPVECQQSQLRMSTYSSNVSPSGPIFSTASVVRQQQGSGVPTLFANAPQPVTIISALPHHIQQPGTVISHITRPIKHESVISTHTHPADLRSPFRPQDVQQPNTVISTLPHSVENPSPINSPLHRVIHQQSPGISALPNCSQQHSSIISSLPHVIQRPSRGPSREPRDMDGTCQSIPIVRSPYLRSPQVDSPTLVVIPNQGTFALSNPEVLPGAFRNSPTIMHSPVPSPVFLRPSPSPLLYQPSPPMPVLHRSSPMVYQPCASPHRFTSGIPPPNETQTHYIDPSQVFAHPVTGQRLVRVQRSSASSSSPGYLDIPAPDPLPPDTRCIVVKATRVVQDGKGAWNYTMYLQKR